jgi:hypothetical protein
MIHLLSSCKRVILMIAVLACTAALLSIGWGHPAPGAQVKLGSEWQCSKRAAIVTVCSRTSQAEPVFDRAPIDPVLLGRV